MPKVLVLDGEIIQDGWKLLRFFSRIIPKHSICVQELFGLYGFGSLATFSLQPRGGRFSLELVDIVNQKETKHLVAATKCHDPRNDTKQRET